MAAGSTGTRADHCHIILNIIIAARFGSLQDGLPSPACNPACLPPSQLANPLDESLSTTSICLLTPLSGLPESSGSTPLFFNRKQLHLVCCVQHGSHPPQAANTPDHVSFGFPFQL